MKSMDQWMIEWSANRKKKRPGFQEGGMAEQGERASEWATRQEEETTTKGGLGSEDERLTSDDTRRRAIRIHRASGRPWHLAG